MRPGIGHVAATTEELQMAGATLRLLIDSRFAQLSKHGARLPNLLERRVENAAAVKLRDAGHRCRWKDAAVGRETQARPTRAGEVVLDARRAVESQPQFFNVVDRDALLTRHIASAPHALQDLCESDRSRLGMRRRD
jgi:hypothetical protein